jgi:hypothetical protein
MTYTLIEDTDGRLWSRNNKTGKLGHVEWVVPFDAGESLADVWQAPIRSPHLPDALRGSE